MMDTLVQHIRLAFRSLARAPGFAIGATLTLTLGIGLATAVFTVANAVLLRRLPATDQDRLVLLQGETRDGKFSNVPLALQDVRDFERRSTSLADVAFFAFRGAVPTPIQTGDQTYPVQIGLVSGNYFDVLGTRPAIGRALRPEDDVAGAAPVLALSYRAWQQRFASDPAIVGKSITMVYTGRTYTIVGVMPQGLDYPRGTEVFAPLIAYSAAGGFLDVISQELDVLARLRRGVSSVQVRAELTNFFARSDAAAWQHNARGVVRPLRDVILGDTKPAVLLITFAAALLLFVTCVNVANLLLVRALGRVKEFTVRAALGASRRRLIAQSLTESGLLALAGGAIGIAFAIAAVNAFVMVAPSSVPRVDEISVSGSTLVVALVITTLTVLASGLAPALFTSRIHARDVLRSGSHQSAGRRVRIVAEALVVAQIALAAVSLAAAGLVTRSLIRLQGLDLSFESGNLLIADLAMRPDQMSDAKRQRAALDMVVANTKALPGVRDVTPVFAVPFVGAGGGIDAHVSTPGQSAEERSANPIVNLEPVAPNYFAMLGVPVLRGRAFTTDDREEATPVAIVSSSVARHLWPGANPIGKQLSASPQNLTVVGVVPDTRYRELQSARPTVYYPLAQSPLPVPSTLLIRTSAAPTEFIPAVRRAVSSGYPGATMASASSLETLLDVPRARPRLNAIVLVLFAAAAVSLAAVGLFAIISTMVRQRTQELGIRMALGATSGNVRAMVMRRGIVLATAGAIIGVAGALVTGRLMSSLLFEVSSADPITLLGVATLIVGVAGIASFFPAQATTRIDPVVALHSP